MNHSKKSTWHQLENSSVNTYNTTALLTRWSGEILGVTKKQKSTGKINVKIKALGIFILKGSMKGFFSNVIFWSTFVCCDAGSLRNSILMFRAPVFGLVS